jgi:hypothetical protein
MGASARLANVHVAGKTGTTQVVSQAAYSDSRELPWERRNHAWFASYAPAESPELVVVVFVEHGGQGSRAAARSPKRPCALFRWFSTQQPLADAPSRVGQLGRCTGASSPALALSGVGLLTVRSAAVARRRIPHIHWSGSAQPGDAGIRDRLSPPAASRPLYLAGLVSVILVLPLGYRAGGAVGWFRIGSVGIQPSEFVKLATALLLARFLSRESERFLAFKEIAVVLAIAGVPMLLIALEPDLGGRDIRADRRRCSWSPACLR